MRRPLLPGLTLAALALCASACSEDQRVGRRCIINQVAGSGDVVINSTALECPTRTCLMMPNQPQDPVTEQCDENNPGTCSGQKVCVNNECRAASEFKGFCTAACSSNDDCDGETSSNTSDRKCARGFVCATPAAVGDFCCQRFCVCRDFLNIPDGGVPIVPSACEAANPANTCCNLPNRRGNPAYPACR